MRGGCQLHHVHDLQEYSRCEMGDVRQKGQLVIAGADVVVPVVCHCTLHWPLTHHMYDFARGTNKNIKVNEGEARARDSMTPEELNSSQVPKVLVAAP